MANLTVTRTADDTFSVVTDIVMSDGSLRADYAMGLSDGALRSVMQPGCIRIGGLMTVKLGGRSLPKVQGLAVGESVTL